MHGNAVTNPLGRLSSMLLLSGLLALTGCGEKAKIGEACTEKGETSECVEGAICDSLSNSSSSVVCLKSCQSDTDCASTESCTGVSGGTGKACHPKS